jgi:hypothetical protein
MMNVRTYGLSGTGDLARDYATHLERVLEVVRANGCQPIYRASPEALRAAWRLYPVYFTPLWAHFMTVAMVLFPIAFVIYQLLRRH